MGRFIARRLVQAVPTLFGVLLITFLLSRLSPSDPVQLMLAGNSEVTAEDRRHSQQLWDDVRAAKEMLSRTATAWIHLPTLGVDAPLGREQLEELARPVLDRALVGPGPYSTGRSSPPARPCAPPAYPHRTSACCLTCRAVDVTPVDHVGSPCLIMVSCDRDHEDKGCGDQCARAGIER